jgi:hypothetical protein
MKIRLFLILLFFLQFDLLVEAQNTEIIGDTIELTINGYKGGQIQWQLSTDSINWKDIYEAKTKNLKYKVIESTYFRAKVKSCLDYYSSITFIYVPSIWETKTDYEFVDSIGKYLSSDKLGGRLPQSRGDTLSRLLIKEVFSKSGILPLQGKDYFQNFVTTSNKHTCNIIGIIPGSDITLKKEIILLSAHYDHLGLNNKGQIFNGADDNASGVAGLCLLARNLNKINLKPKRTLLFVVTGAEEPYPYLQGMKYFKKSNIIDTTAIKYGINYDMIGRMHGDSLWFYYRNITNEMIKKITILNSNNLKPIFSIRSLFGSSQSDHLVLENLNIPCFTIDTGTHSDYHTVFDD